MKHFKAVRKHRQMQSLAEMGRHRERMRILWAWTRTTLRSGRSRCAARLLMLTRPPSLILLGRVQVVRLHVPRLAVLLDHRATTRP